MPTGEAWRDRAVATRFAGERAAVVPESRAQIDVLLHVLRLRAAAVARVVDLGCGDGVLLDAVLSAFPAATGLGLDYSAPTREMATRHLAEWLRALGFVDVDVFWKWFELALFGGTKPCS